MARNNGSASRAIMREARQRSADYNLPLDEALRQVLQMREEDRREAQMPHEGDLPKNQGFV